MMIRISRRKGGETAVKEITPKPQYMSLDSVAGVASVETQAVDVESTVVENQRTNRLADGLSPDVDPYEE